MKTSHLVCAALLIAAAPLAHADSATITVTGNVLPGTCTIAPTLDVTLDDIDATDLKAGHDNGLKPAVLNFTSCVGVAGIDLTFDGTDDAAQDGHWKNLASTGGGPRGGVGLVEGTARHRLRKKTTNRNGVVK
ncbi:fimbrial protein, partial [Streptomyces niveus]|uniref:fimbrial protein n=1 Tax=Streptomyces niveus TaxID=193462 RepID=UPI003674321A